MQAYADTLKTEIAIDLARPDLDVLDIGSGMGRVTLPMSAICRRVVGIDTDIERVRQVSDELRDLPAGEVIQADAQDLPFPDASFDLVFCYSTLVIVPDPKRALAEIRRVLKPNGRAVIDLTGRHNANCRHWRDYYAERGTPYHGFTWREANAMLEDAGFVIERVHACGWSRSHLYLPVLRNYPKITQLMHSGRKPDADYVLSNIWPLSRRASQWYFIVRP